jgi:hypothetical protein
MVTPPAHTHVWGPCQYNSKLWLWVQHCTVTNCLVTQKCTP